MTDRKSTALILSFALVFSSAATLRADAPAVDSDPGASAAAPAPKASAPAAAPSDLRDAVLSAPITPRTPLPFPPGLIYRDPAAPVDVRVEDLLARMTLDEKIDMLSGVNMMDLRANPRLGVPALKMTDGPLGVRVETGDKATAFPAGIAMASSFDSELMKQVGAALGRETLALGRDMLLGPCINIARAPQGGRNFESFGEDPYLAAQMAVAWVTGLQSQKVLASTKHFALNNQEIDRMTVDVHAGERAMHEIYLPAFHAAVAAGTWTVMAAYNRVNGEHASENQYLLNEVLKNRWGFKGFVVSDWDATHSTIAASNHGLDVEMPSGQYFGGGKLQSAITDGKVSVGAIDDKVRRVLRAMIGGGVFDRKDGDRPARSTVNSPENQAVAQRMTEEGIVLLKNDGALPLEKIRTLAVVGPSAATYRAGGGSSMVPAAHVVTALEGLKARLGNAVAIRYALGAPMAGDLKPIESSALTPPPGKASGHGLWGEYFKNKDLKGEPVFARLDAKVDSDWDMNSPDARVGSENFSIRWTGRLRVPKSGAYDIATRADDGTRLWLDGNLLVDDWSDHPPVTKSKRVNLKAGRDYDIRLEYYQGGGGASVTLGWLVSPTDEIKDAVTAAKRADAVVVFAGASDQIEGEGSDRPSLALPDGQDKLIQAVAKANKNVIVVLQVGSPVLTTGWDAKARAIVQAWYPGEEGGMAIADVLLGKVNPSGKTPISWPKRWEDSPAFGHYPGKDGSVDYTEGIYVGYRGFDKHKIEPRFPFGYGLSYTTFQYSNMKIDVRDASALSPDVEVAVDIQNTGSRRGAEIAQLYVHDETPKIDRPEQELKGFARLELAPGETKTAKYHLDRSSFAYYDEAAHDWALPPGLFTIKVGASSRDIKLSQNLELK